MRILNVSDESVHSAFDVPAISTSRAIPRLNLGWTATIMLAGALTQVFYYQAAPVASCNLLPVRMLAGTTYDEAAQHDNTTGID
ncbi:hypothetical protein [Paraburkholderia sp. 40]|uniref:hypothetical protein n=1 Tax=unclassified Paraburkholderia TaxID=2615204 RepID=UPI003D22EB8C